VRQLESEFIQFARELDLARVLGNESGKNAITEKKSELAACVGMLEDAEKRLNNLVSAVEVGGDIAILVTRMRAAESQVNDLKKQRLELQTELLTLTNIAQDEQSSYETLSKLMEQLESKDIDLEDKLRLRFRMQTEVQKVTRRLLLYPGGPCKPPVEVAKLTTELKGFGYDDDQIRAYFDNLPIKPDRKQRYFIAFMRNGIVRSVKEGKALETDVGEAAYELASI
jgi:hypothetical protein